MRSTEDWTARLHQLARSLSLGMVRCRTEMVSQREGDEFTTTVVIGEVVVAVGQGSSAAHAEERAARQACAELENRIAWTVVW